MSYSPSAILAELGIPVRRAWLRDTWAAWSSEDRVIVLAEGLSPVQERCVLAHEVEHVLADDYQCGLGLDTPGTINELLRHREFQADLGAARKLIGISDLARIAQQGIDMTDTAAALQVTERMLWVRLYDLQGEAWPATLKIAG